MRVSEIYAADIAAGSLLISESREVAKLLLANATEEDWKQAIRGDNVLMKRSPASAKRQTRLIRNRLELMQPELWEIVTDGSYDSCVQALMAATVKQSRLLGDFLLEVKSTKVQVFESQLSLRDWDKFFETCEQRAPEITSWAETTKKKVRQVVFRILAEAKYMDSTKSMKLIPVRILPEIQSYLKSHSEYYLIRCMGIFE
ncbi:MAG TPA: DUF1819 family protein [bacterium]|nr:DUF1819 family protein [bacterium]